MNEMSVDANSENPSPYMFLNPIDTNLGSEAEVQAILFKFLEEAGPTQKIISVIFNQG